MQESRMTQKHLPLLDKLLKIPALHGFKDSDIDHLLECSQVVKYEMGEFILREGQTDNNLYFLVSGKVQIRKKDKPVAVLQRAGDIFGEMGLVDGAVKSATVIAMKESICMITDITSLDSVEPKQRINLLYVLFRVFSQVLAEKLRVTTQKLTILQGKLADFEVWRNE